MDSNSPRSPLDDGEIGDDDSKEFDDGYDENLMGDEEDKKKLAQMTEKEREQELFNRSERRETLKIRFEIERKLRTKAKKREQEKKQSKQVRARKRLRASEVYSSDESSEESDEYTPETDKSAALHEVNASSRSTNKIATRASAMLDSSSSSPSSASSASSSNSSSESEHERDDDDSNQEGSIGQKEDFEITLADLKTLQLKRERIEQWVYAPFFRDTAIGLFVKISVGNHPHTKEHMYKIAQIIDITKSIKVYALDEFGKYRTDKQCLVRIGGVDRTYNMSFVSNRSFDEADYSKWRDSYDLDEFNRRMSKDYFEQKKNDLLKAMNYEYRDEDIRIEVRERSKFKESPYNFALRKTELMGEKAEAEATNDYEKARQIQQIIDELEEKAKELEKSRNSKTFSAISFVNERNRVKNIEESERILKESKSVKTEDPFTRRKCTPTIVSNKNSNGDLSNNRTNDKNSQDALNSKSVNTGNNGTSRVKAESVKSVDDLFSAHAGIDLEIDIDI